MRNLLLVLVGILDLSANFPYIRDSLKDKTKPNVASWSTWTLINGIAALSALAAGEATNTVILGASYFIGSFTILLIALFRGTRKYTFVDGICQALAVTGVILWQISNNPNIALAFAILADVFAVIPTVRHGYLYPNEETWLTFAIASMGALAFIGLASSISFASLAIPIEFFLANASIASVILFRKKKLAPKNL